MRYGQIEPGEPIDSTDPPQGTLDANIHTNFDRFIVTFDAPNYVYIDDIEVTVSDGEVPVVIATRRPDDGEPEELQIVLDRPMTVGETTTFTFPGGQSVEYTLLRGRPPPIPTMSAWGVVVTLLAILTLGTLVFRRCARCS